MDLGARWTQHFPSFWYFLFTGAVQLPVSSCPKYTRCFTQVMSEEKQEVGDVSLELDTFTISENCWSEEVVSNVSCFVRTISGIIVELEFVVNFSHQSEYKGLVLPVKWYKWTSVILCWSSSSTQGFQCLGVFFGNVVLHTCWKSCTDPKKGLFDPILPWFYLSGWYRPEAS